MIVRWIVPKLKAKGIVGKDRNKPGRPLVAEMGGISVILGFFAGVSCVTALDGISERGGELLNVSLSAIMGAAFVGILDDLFDLQQRYKALLPFVLALPFGTVVGTEITIPYIAVIDLGPWMIVAAAFAVTCAANAANMLEGFNGLGTGLGIIMALVLLILCVHHQRMDGAYLLVPLLGGLIAFLWFNRYPASVFPGDTMMLFMGATLAAAGIMSDLYLQTIFIFFPMIIEFFLKTRGRFRAENYATRSANGVLEYRGRIESLTHIFMRHSKCTEKALVGKIWALEAVFCITVMVVDFIV